METPNTAALIPRLRDLGLTERSVERVFRTFNANAKPFREAVNGGS
jgi:hypothetical protein